MTLCNNFIRETGTTVVHDCLRYVFTTTLCKMINLLDYILAPFILPFLLKNLLLSVSNLPPAGKCYHRPGCALLLVSLQLLLMTYPSAATENTDNDVAVASDDAINNDAASDGNDIEKMLVKRY